MLRKLIAAAIVFVAGYALGATFGYKAAVVDYVENDAQKLEQAADSMYPSPHEGARTVHDEVGALIEEVENEDAEGETADGENRAFQ